MNDRFDNKTTTILQEIELFSHSYIVKRFSSKSNRQIRLIEAGEVLQLCANYGLSADELVGEFNTFGPLYVDSHSIVDVSDLCSSQCSHHDQGQSVSLVDDAAAVLPEMLATASIHNDIDHDSESDAAFDADLPIDNDDNDDELDDISKTSMDTIIARGFIKPHRFITQVSSFPNLTVLYKILVTLPVTSCSAERALSKLRIIKNRLRSSMLDNWMSAMMILAAEKSILDRIKNEDIN